MTTKTTKKKPPRITPSILRGLWVYAQLAEADIETDPKAFHPQTHRNCSAASRWLRETMRELGVTPGPM